MIQVNEYFNGTVKSLAYQTSEGKSTVGVMEAGEFEFGTSQPEIMTIIEGTLSVQLPGQQDWQNYTNGQTFEVAGNVSFKVKAAAQVAYLCQYR